MHRAYVDIKLNACKLPIHGFWILQGIILGCICFNMDWEDQAERATAAMKDACGSLEADRPSADIQFACITSDENDL